MHHAMQAFARANATYIPDHTASSASGHGAQSGTDHVKLPVHNSIHERFETAEPDANIRCPPMSLTRRLGPVTVPEHVASTLRSKHLGDSVSADGLQIDSGM